ncbi:MAG: hypothetical protein MO852_17030, partial [Candidatus Devosia euplotis]|nr:hypothetical protein [Candidatus Devosia euplotis]
MDFGGKGRIEAVGHQIVPGLAVDEIADHDHAHGIVGIGKERHAGPTEFGAYHQSGYGRNYDDEDQPPIEAGVSGGGLGRDMVLTLGWPQHDPEGGLKCGLAVAVNKTSYR